MLGSALGGTFCLEVSEREAPCRYKGLWLSGQDPLSSPLALIPPNKRSLLPEGQESPTGQALSSACSIFPAPLGSFNGSDSHLPSSDPGGSQQTVVVAVSPPYAASPSCWDWHPDPPHPAPTDRAGGWSWGWAAVLVPRAGSLGPSSAEGCCVQGAGGAIVERSQTCRAVWVMGNPTAFATPSAQEIFEIRPCAMAG